MNDSQTERAMQVLREEYEELDNAGEVIIKPALLAAHAIERIDPASDSPVLVSWLAVLQMRQMARSICRTVSQLDDPSKAEQGALFDGQLQRRYPATREGEEVYVLRERLTLAERKANSARLRAESIAKARHADALDAETDALLAHGHFSDAA